MFFLDRFLFVPLVFGIRRRLDKRILVIIRLGVIPIKSIYFFYYEYMFGWRI